MGVLFFENHDLTTGQVETVCKNLKNVKARDESGLIYELFKPPYAGADLYNSLTLLFKRIKDGLIVPNFLQLMSITSFYKLKGLKCDLSNERGVFNVSKVRSILDILTLKFTQLLTVISVTQMWEVASTET